MSNSNGLSSNMSAGVEETKAIVFNKLKEVKYLGRCTFEIDESDKWLTLKTNVEGFPNIEAPLNRYFIQRNNWLCVINNLSNNCFVVIFASKSACDIAINKIKQIRFDQPPYPSNNANTEIQHFKNNVFVPILKAVQNEIPEYMTLKAMIIELVNSFEPNEGKLFLNSAGDLQLPPPDKAERTDDQVENQCPQRKRQRSVFKDPSANGVTNVPIFELFTFFQHGVYTKRLIIFTTAEKKMCFEFYCMDNYNNYYACKGCLRKKFTMPVKVITDSNGNRKLYFGEKQHVCQPMNYVPEYYKSRKIVKFPNFTVCARNLKFQRIQQRMLIWDSDDRTLWREYHLYRSATRYHCIDCKKKYKRYVSAKLHHSGVSEQNDFVELSHIEHLCEHRKF